MSTALSVRPPATAPAPTVPLVTGESVRYANLDLAASAPPLRSVVDHVAELLPYYASVHRGAGYSSQVSTSVLERARDTVGRFLGARPGDVVVFTRNTTDALNLLAASVPGAVLCLDSEHHANLLPWVDGPHHVLPAAPTIAQTLDDLRAALRDGSFALVTLAGAGNVTGELLPLPEIAGIVHAAGARLAVDAAQLAPHRRVDLAATGIDYLALSGHKLYAPYGAGVLVGRRDWLDAAPPHLAGGGASHSVTTDGNDVRVEWAPAPQRHEGGTPNVLGAAALAQACRALDPVIDEIAPEHERALLHRLLDGLATVPGVHPLRTWSDSTDRVGVVAFTVDHHAPGRVAAYLSAEHGIGVRDGKFCAHPLVDRLTGSNEGAVRASIGIGTTADDIDRLLDALRGLTKRGARWDYAVIDGRWAPTADPRDLDPLGLGRATADAPGCGA
ncbi:MULTISPECIES: aminotransferase class V-fold PLP-dependent enzyme [unclassified Pseudonocardia]|uniref:aminotransferase class V-fold PLP-dependent enzyme n=1 Tax=unclassified Pseudonocardia TaxID=2619320 RepID=UPI00095EAF91|nr:MULTISPECIES: aminotransferase class V-fold PLP-dependent enzyme [unclassified Pseudonocardia]MBN9097002.1 aminotransferase class V-fold PLP-dependent enzyme [Pseudonocardia sp.]OJY46251.1 MAG: cysteine desulfurase [Pseudonocardia sp. 73-21]